MGWLKPESQFWFCIYLLGDFCCCVFLLWASGFIISKTVAAMWGEGEGHPGQKNEK